MKKIVGSLVRNLKPTCVLICAWDVLSEHENHRYRYLYVYTPFTCTRTK